MQDTIGFAGLTLDRYKFTAVNMSKMGPAYDGKANGIFPIGPDVGPGAFGIHWPTLMRITDVDPLL